MKLVTFTHAGSTRIGVVDGDEVVDLAAAAPDLPTEMVAFLEAGDPALHAAHAALGGGPRFALSDVTLEAPVLRVTGYDLPYPPSRVEEEFLPDLDRVLDAVDRAMAF